jgi:hypothetical protein
MKYTVKVFTPKDGYILADFCDTLEDAETCAKYEGKKRKADAIIIEGSNIIKQVRYKPKTPKKVAC